jgi:hypothetical protein
MNKFRDWYLSNVTEITWFIIGVCTHSGLTALARENYTDAVLNFGLAYLNYILNKR